MTNMPGEDSAPGLGPMALERWLPGALGCTYSGKQPRFSRIMAAMLAQLQDRNNGKNLYVYWGQCRSVSFNVSSDSQTLRRKGSLPLAHEWIRAAGRGACRMPSLLKAKASRSCEFAREFKKLKLVCPAFKTQIPVYEKGGG